MDKIKELIMAILKIDRYSMQTPEASEVIMYAQKIADRCFRIVEDDISSLRLKALLLKSEQPKMAEALERCKALIAAAAEHPEQKSNKWGHKFKLSKVKDDPMIHYAPVEAEEVEHDE